MTRRVFDFILRPSFSLSLFVVKRSVVLWKSFGGELVLFSCVFKRGGKALPSEDWDESPRAAGLRFACSSFFVQREESIALDLLCGLTANLAGLKSRPSSS